MESDETDLELFFQDPETKPKEIWGTLYLLRGDINRCLEHRILWPSAMLILAGIDLLGKFNAGEDEPGRVSIRFKEFIREYFPHNSHEEVNIIFQIRNALLHSFGLYSNFWDKSTSRTVEYNFIISEKKIPISKTEISKDKYSVTIGIEDLRERFEEAIEHYYTKLKSDKNLQDNFKKMFPNYGVVLPANNRIHRI